MGTSQAEVKTPMGYRDVTHSAGDPSVKIWQYDVIRGITLDREIEETHCGRDILVYLFYSREHRIRGRAFPQDEIITLNKPYDLIVQNRHPHEPRLVVGSRVLMKVERFSQNRAGRFYVLAKALKALD